MQRTKYYFLGIIFVLLLIPIYTPANALQQTAGKIILELNVGESQTIQWGIVSDETEDVNIIVTAAGVGSELLSFEKLFSLSPKELHWIDITIDVPADYENDVYVNPTITATQNGKEGGMVIINIAMQKELKILIGDAVIPEPKVVNVPVPEQVEIVTETVKPKVVKEAPTGGFMIKEGDTVEIQMVPEPEPKCGAGTEMVDGFCKVVKDNSDGGGGCLIATAAYGTELAPQVQFLREIRDNTVMSTASGTAFMGSFNTLYYSFAPIIADMERENPMFQEAVRLFITPMISTLSIMSLAENGSEVKVLGLGISVIILNFGMYIAAPVLVIRKVHNYHK